MPTFEYCVCHVQQDRVTFANHQWQGRQPIDTADPQASLVHCPFVWEYLNLAGREGWELISALPQNHISDQQAFVLFLRRSHA